MFVALLNIFLAFDTHLHLRKHITERKFMFNQAWRHGRRTCYLILGNKIRCVTSVWRSSVMGNVNILTTKTARWSLLTFTADYITTCCAQTLFCFLPEIKTLGRQQSKYRRMNMCRKILCMSLKLNINESFKSTPKTCDGIEFNDDCISVCVCNI